MKNSRATIFWVICLENTYNKIDGIPLSYEYLQNIHKVVRNAATTAAAAAGQQNDFHPT